MAHGSIMELENGKHNRVLLAGPSYKGLEYSIRFALASLSAILSGITSISNNASVIINYGVLNEIIIETLQMVNKISAKMKLIEYNSVCNLYVDMESHRTLR
jgi:hypothetical protein